MQFRSKVNPVLHRSWADDFGEFDAQRDYPERLRQLLSRNGAFSLGMVSHDLARSRPHQGEQCGFTRLVRMKAALRHELSKLMV